MAELRIEDILLKRKGNEQITLPNDFVLKGRYQIMGVHGRGGMSTVYVAKDAGLNRIVAIKQTEVRDDAEGEIMLKSALQESSLLKSLQHVSIPSIYDIFNESRLLFIVMEFLEGEDLSKVLQAIYRDRLEQGIREFAADDSREELGGYLPEKLAVSVALQVANTLRYLHGLEHKVVYRDLKPSNVMLQDGNKIKLFDFGVSRQFDGTYDPSLTETNMGTRTYAAPEVFAKGSRFDERIDIYALGMMLHVMLTGQNIGKYPEKRRGLTKLKPELSKGLEIIVERCLQADPDARYQTAEEVIYDLQRYKELEKGFRRKHILKLSIFGGLLGVSLLSGLFTLYSLNDTIQAQNKRYTSILEQVSISKNPTQLKEAYKLFPSRLDAYQEAIKLYKLDGAFTDSESKELMTYLNENILELQNQKGYGELAYDIGSLYWFYYNTEGLTGYKSSVRWFEDAIKYGTTQSKNARLYADVGRFYDEIVLNVTEARDSGLYAKHWSKIKEILQDTYTSDAVKVQIVDLVFSTINLYANQLRSDGVSVSEIRSEFNKTKELLASVSDSSTVIKDRKATLVKTSQTQIEAKVSALEKGLLNNGGGN